MTVRDEQSTLYRVANIEALDKVLIETVRGLLIMSHQHSSGALPFGRERLCPTGQYCAFSGNSSYLVLLRKQSIYGRWRECAPKISK